MAKSTCIKCGKSSFESMEIEPAKSNYKMYAIQCASCGGVVGIVPFMNTSAMLIEQNKAIEAIAKHVGAAVTLRTT